jgi:hypothetical protein
MNKLFTVHRLNTKGLELAGTIAQAFSDFLDTIEATCPDGRDLAIVRTKLQEANFFAKRSIAELPVNQDGGQ